ncbi:MAG: GTPase [Candidatus Levybacteria bacterium RIFCSPHIGHO2_01_FULL_38_26]|nr:MAG: GTPase [Candidatus Levybacteria bacterium RIFCSPHIGHO2_01_FULL_38_26]
MRRTRVIIMGAAGRDFHNFNVFFRNKKAYEVVAFTATQIPGIENKVYPAILSGKLYPKGIPIYSESQLSTLIEDNNVEKVVFAYSDISHEEVMHKASQVIAAGADFWLLGTHSTTLHTHVPVISIGAVRTGSGKSQTSRKVASILRKLGKRVVVIRHPMPYGDLSKQIVQRFATYKDLNKNKCTIEEREEYEPHIDLGAIVYAGVDYEKILRRAEKEADTIVWDGGNNDFSFYRPDLHIVIADALRPGHELRYHPGEASLRMADIVIINKVNDASFTAVDQIRENIRKVNYDAVIIEANSHITAEKKEQIRGKRVLVIEDGPTLTHGGMTYGAGFVAAKIYHAKEIVSPLSYAVGSIKDVFERYPHTRDVLPAMGYSSEQIKELEKTINSMPIDLVVIGTPVNLQKVLKIKKPSVRVHYELEEITKPNLEEEIKSFLEVEEKTRE